MAKSLKLLLVENVESLGIVGDVVNVRTGYARNYLLPRSLATQPSDDKIKELAGKRAVAQKEVEALRSARVALNDKLKGTELTLIRSCNDQGILYGAITQQDLAASLKEQGFAVNARDIRIPQTIKRVDSFDIHVKLDTDLDQIIKVHVKPDRDLNPSGAAPAAAAGAEGEAGAAPAGAGDRPERGDRGDRGERPERRRRDAWMLPDESTRVVGWGTAKKEDGKGDDKKSDKPAKADKKADGEKKSKKKAE
jgi:large subunit ribosomal protein L9